MLKLFFMKLGYVTKSSSVEYVSDIAVVSGASFI